MRIRTIAAKFISSLLCAVFLSSGLLIPAIPALAQRRAIIVSAEQPNVWTLEQAHYLLAQMHRRNLDLKATGVGELDPNEINGLNFDVLKSLLDVGVAFDEAAGFNNSLLKTRKGFDAERAIKLQNRRDALTDESFTLNREIAKLGREQALAESKEDKDTLGAQIGELKEVKAGVDQEISRLDADIKTAGGPTGELQATDAPPSADPGKLPKSTFDDAFKDVTKKLIDRFNEAPKLNATLRLDNFLQMQYEIIAKQLTLLRDEVGPGERVIFLELPQTVNASYDKANKKWAQSWWKVAGYTKLKTPVKDTRKNSIRRLQIERAQAAPITPGGPVNEKDLTSPASEDDKELLTMGQVVQDAIKAYGTDGEKGNSSRVDFVSLSPTGGAIKIQNRSVRTVELIPRQSSVNVNDIKLRARSGALTVVARTLFGVGARLNYQRQRETFSQFVQQELYSSSFGKGSTEFGWTFTPMPGTERVMSGTRTTYAVMVVPVEAEALILQSTGCYFPRSDYQPISFDNTGEDRWTSSDEHRCSEHKGFVIPIPSGGNDQNNDFWVDGLQYVPTDKTDRVVLSIYGRNFPAQIGILIDGIALTQSIGVAQPLIRDDSVAFRDASAELKEGKVIGRLERIDSKQIVAVFDRPTGRDGTQPVITLTAPGKAQILNTLSLYINGTPNTTLRDAALMFGKKAAEKDKFRIDKLEIFRSNVRGYLRAVIRGEGFENPLGTPAITSLIINGRSETNYRVDSPTHMSAEFRLPSDEIVRITIVSRNADPTKTLTAVSDPVSNPARLQIASTTIVSYEAATADEPGALVIRIEGSGFTDALRSSMGELAVKSATEAILKITDPESAAVVTLTDGETGQQVKTIVTRSIVPK
jgi:hypothetical protein